MQAIISPDMYYAYIRLPDEHSETPPEILDDPKLYPFFKDCLGALDGTHILATVPAKD